MKRAYISSLIVPIETHMTINNTPTVLFDKFKILGEQVPKISKITDTLYLSSKYFTENDLRKLEITHILNISNEEDKDYPGIKSLFININDNEYNNNDNSIDNYFSMTYNYIQEVINTNGRVLVHCNMGISRSPTIIISYLMKSLQKPYDEILEFVKLKRPIIEPCLIFEIILLEYQKKIGIS